MLEVLALIPQALQVPCTETLLPLAAAALFPDVVSKYAAICPQLFLFSDAALLSWL